MTLENDEGTRKIIAVRDIAFEALKRLHNSQAGYDVGRAAVVIKGCEVVLKSVGTELAYRTLLEKEKKKLKVRT